MPKQFTLPVILLFAAHFVFSQTPGNPGNMHLPRISIHPRYTRILIGDSVEGIRWAPWAYYIRTDVGSGYISWKALQMTEGLESLSRIIDEQSLEEYKKIAISPDRPKTKADAFLSITANKKSIALNKKSMPFLPG